MKERNKFPYTENYCEENIYLLAANLQFHGERAYALFISNLEGRVAMVRQRARPEGVVLWDYHVVLLSRDPDWNVWDFDTTGEFPLSANDYLQLSFPIDAPDAYRPLFRLVEVDTFLRDFSSDRSHMRDASGRFLSPPPPWPPIHAELESNLTRFIDMKDPSVGRVMTRAELGQLVGSQQAREENVVSP